MAFEFEPLKLILLGLEDDVGSFQIPVEDCHLLIDQRLGQIAFHPQLEQLLVEIVVLSLNLFDARGKL